MAHTIWNQVYEQMGGTYGTNDPRNKAAWDAAWEAYNNANKATRDKEWTGGYGKIYENANDKIAEQNQDLNLRLDNGAGKYRVEQDKTKKDSDEGWYNRDDGSSYHYKDGNLEGVEDQNIINEFNQAKANNDKAFGSWKDNQKLSNNEYYSRYGIGYQDALNGFGNQDKQVNLDERHLYDTFGLGGVNPYHAKGIQDLQVRFSPDADPYTQNDATDLSNMLKNNELIGWSNQYNKSDNTMKDDSGDNRLSPEAYAQRSLLEKPVILEDEFNKGNFSALTDLANGDIESLDDLAGRVAEYTGGYFNKLDPAWELFNSPSDYHNLLNDEDNKTNYFKMKPIASHAKELAKNNKKEEYEKLLREADINPDEYDLSDYNNYDTLYNAYNTNKNYLTNAALIDSLGKQNNYKLSRDYNPDIDRQIASSLLGNKVKNNDESIIDYDINPTRFLERTDKDDRASYDSNFLIRKDIPSFLKNQKEYQKMFPWSPNDDHMSGFLNAFDNASIRNALKRAGYNLKGDY